MGHKSKKEKKKKKKSKRETEEQIKEGGRHRESESDEEEVETHKKNTNTDSETTNTDAVGERMSICDDSECMETGNTDNVKGDTTQRDVSPPKVITTETIGITLESSNNTVTTQEITGGKTLTNTVTTQKSEGGKQ